MGGVWESLVKSVKRSLKVITRDRVFTEESLYTFLCEVESVINNRPLTPTSDSISDFEALTPNHFLLGTKVTNYSLGSFNPREINYGKKWRAVQAALNMFWTRWLREYLPSLTDRKKWTTNSRNLEIGDLVILVSKNPVRSAWSTGRVIETYPSVDGVVRSVKVKTTNNEFVRPTASLCLLEDYPNSNITLVFLRRRLLRYIRNSFLPSVNQTLLIYIFFGCVENCSRERFMTLKFRLEFSKRNFLS